MSYNILAEIYTDDKSIKGKFNKEHLDFRERSLKIMAEIRESDPDLICLQEVDNFETVYQPFLASMGYEFQTEWRREDNDAILLGYKKDKFELIDTVNI